MRETNESFDSCVSSKQKEHDRFNERRISQNFRLFLMYNLSVVNFRIVLLT